MGVNNKQRRAAKQKERTRQRARSSSGFKPQGRPGAAPGDALYALADLHVRAALRRLLRRRPDAAELRQRADILLAQVGPGSAELVGEVLAEVLTSIVDGTISGGWDPGDLAQVVRRRDETWLPLLAATLHEHSRSTGRTDRWWRVSVESIAPASRLLLAAPEDIATALGLTSLLIRLPVLDEQSLTASFSDDSPPVEHTKWQQARALLAKAESTDFGPEAEALVAKAQELISRYALQALIDSYAEDSSGAGRRRAAVPRRLWLDRPYVRAKGTLVSEVARANHCRAALAEDDEFVLLVGHETDLHAVDLLVTSLLAQADVAMLRRGRADHGPGSRARSRSFRQSFLMAFAVRIGERLQAAHDTAVSDQPGALPVLHDHDILVREAFDAMVPHTEGRAVTVSDYAGWEAGTTAADLALLDVNGRLEAEAARPEPAERRQ